MTKNKSQRKYIIAASVIALAILLQPLSLIMTQNHLSDRLAAMILGEEKQAGKVETKGKTIELGLNPHINGDINAEIVLVEYSDFQCPFCQKFHVTTQNILKNSNGKVALVYKHFPLEFHPEALPAAIASECVAKLSGAKANENFFKFADAVFSGAAKLDAQGYLKQAGLLGLQAAAFNTCIADPATKKIVEQNQAEGAGLGVQGTPNTFITKKTENGFEILDNINGAQPEAEVQALINTYLKK